MSFPAVSVLDSFGRTESSLSNEGKWKNLFESGGNKGKCDENEWETASGSTKEGAYWHPTTFKERGVSLEFTFKKSTNSGNYWSVWACISNPEEVHFTGYRLKVVAESAGEGGFTYKLEKAVLGVWTVMAEEATVTLHKEDRFGLAVQGGQVSGWRKKGAGAWEEILTHSDSSYTEGYSGFNVIAQDGNVINFESGPVEGPPPVITNPGTRHSTINTPVSLQIMATNTTEYFAAGLPEGLSINEGTGLITGEPTNLETAKVKLTAKGPGGESEAEFEWVIEEAGSHKKNRTFMIL